MRTKPIAIYLFLASSVWAQANRRVFVDPPQPLTVKAGQAVSQTTRVSIEAGSHVNSDKPSNEFLIPFRLEWEAGPLTAVAIHYPAAEEVQVGPDKLRVFTGSFGVTTEFKAGAGVPAGKTQMKGKLHYQACNTQMCFRPATTEVTLPVLIQ